jgi:hypothetical protein
MLSTTKSTSAQQVQTPKIVTQSVSLISPTQSRYSERFCEARGPRKRRVKRQSFVDSVFMRMF